jgi:hypothetical protein
MVIKNANAKVMIVSNHVINAGSPDARNISSLNPWELKESFRTCCRKGCWKIKCPPTNALENPVTTFKGVLIVSGRQ